MSQVPQPLSVSQKRKFRGHFDGKVVVIDEPVDLTAGEQVFVHAVKAAADVDGPKIHELPPEKRAAALEELFATLEDDIHVPPEQWTRESFYEDDKD